MDRPPHRPGPGERERFRAAGLADDLIRLGRTLTTEALDAHEATARHGSQQPTAG